MKKRVFQNHKFFIIFLFVLILAAGFAQAAEEEKPVELEIVYPQIPGATTPKYVSTGLPQYVDYIFRFAVIVIGLIVLGALIYSGVQYLTSAGNPEKLSNAKKGIFSAVLGAVILLSSYLIFTTINPQLVILEAPEQPVIEPTIPSGIYLCNYPVDNINGIINDYISGDKDRRIAAVEEFMGKIQTKKGGCFRLEKSAPSLTVGGGIKKFEFDPKKHTVFAIPREKEPGSDKPSEWVYDYGIVFHEEDNFQGKCAIGITYNNVWWREYFENPFKARSVTLFQKLKEEPGGQGVILYQCLDYNDPTFCPEGFEGKPEERSFKPAGDIEFVGPDKLGEKLTSGIEKEWVEGGIWKFKIKYYEKEIIKAEHVGTRSIKINPEGGYFAVLLGENLAKYRSKENPTGSFCEVISNDDPNLLNNRIGRCGPKCQVVSSKDETKDWQVKNCYPCLKSMYVVKGQVLK